MDVYANKFLELLRYVKYIMDENAKIQCFLSGLPHSFKYRSEFGEPLIQVDIGAHPPIPREKQFSILAVFQQFFGFQTFGVVLRP
jgi:hypothetical protein